MSETLRIAVVAGTLGQGGAEKQLFYLCRSLLKKGCEIAAYCLRREEYYESRFCGMGLRPTWIGRYKNPVFRALALRSRVRRCRPHLVYASHFFCNLYASIAAHSVGACSIGSIRGDGLYDIEQNGVWSLALMSSPTMLVVNSHRAREQIAGLGIVPSKVFVLSNVINLGEFDDHACEASALGRENRSGVLIVAVGRLVPVKRLDRFICAVASARRTVPGLVGVVIGDGPERSRLEDLARQTGLGQDALRFIGHCPNVPALLKQADILALTSDREGFPNVILEAMAAGIPVVTTPAGDSGSVVEDGKTGFVCRCEDALGMAGRFVELARSASLRKRLGDAGRRRAEAHYSDTGLADRFVRIVLEGAKLNGRVSLVSLCERVIA